MHKDTADVVNFLLTNHIELIREPLNGELSQIYCLFDAKDLTEESFIAIMHEIREVAKGAFVLETNPISGEEAIRFVDTVILNELYHLLKNKKRVRQKEETRSVNKADKFNRLIEYKESNFLYRIQHILDRKTQACMLASERARFVYPTTPIVPRCDRQDHRALLAQCVIIVNNKIVSLKWSNFITNGDDFIHCVQNKIHFVPNIKPKTDVSLGDCSYLDTCHKMHSCRYVHYLPYIPQALEIKYKKQLSEQNEIRAINPAICLYTRGECCTNLSRYVTPPQWIQCDVRKFDLQSLGKFSAVIADPAWNIHMNLPYGTCNDTELLNLPLEILQDEGVLLLWVTGRAIELGKESLQKWGYRVTNEISWVKTNQLGRTIVTGRTGHWLNHSKEHLLVGLKGDPTWINRNVDVDLIVAPTRETSHKPDDLYGIVERLVGLHSRKLEIFGRTHNLRPGWLTIGNQLDGVHLVDPEIKRKIVC
ncbi:N6-adenosine-methyltransferase IME4 [Nakaseomyces bracarensis]|uniref:mRNA m(6)A methyltransferase n=1 Tax=Nakaseomyces bracarensis TaxID=273131 RepID=A0ABR4NVE3_9SACH